MKRLKSKKSGLRMRYPQPPISTFDNMGDPIMMIQGHGQDLDFKDLSSAFPDKVECAFVLNLIPMDQEVGVTIDFGGDQKITKDNIYDNQGGPIVYARAEWGQPTHITVTRQNMFYPLDKDLSVQVTSSDMAFRTLEGGPLELEPGQEYPYGGVLSHDGSLDQVCQWNVSWGQDQGDQMQESSRGQSLADRIHQGELKIHLVAHDIHRMQAYNADASVFQNTNLLLSEPEGAFEPTKQAYASHAYRMIDADKIRVTFFRQLHDDRAISDDLA